MKLYIADAFTEELFGGNPAGVAILEDGEDFPTDETMRKTAAELRYSETAFIKQLSEKEFKIRYFTPADEVDLCGHATIASFTCLADAGLVKAGETYINHTLAGKLNIQVQDGFIMMDMATPQHIATMEDEAAIRELYDVMGLPYEHCVTDEKDGQQVELLPMMISTGLPDIIMPVSSRAVLTEIAPDFKRLSDLSEKYEVVGVHAFTLDADEPDITAHCRNFAPLYDIDEEAATGTSNGALTYYLYHNGLLETGASSAFIQGEVMDRPSKILSYLTKEAAGDISIQVGGNAVILAKGDLLL